MNTRRITLISILTAALILAAIFAFQTLVVGNVMAAANSPVGSWTVTAKPDGGMPPPFTIRLIFSSDGTLTEIEDSGAVGLGVWEKLSGNQYTFTSLVYVPQGGAILQAKVISTITLNDKEHYSGPYFFELRDPGGNFIVNGFGTATGVRNHVEPMPK
jgi:hypothetical protein